MKALFALTVLLLSLSGSQCLADLMLFKISNPSHCPEGLIIKTKLTDGLIQFDIEPSTSIEEQGITLLHCSYTAPSLCLMGGWVCIWPTTYLVNENTNEQLQLIHAINIPVSPKRKFFNSRGEHFSFTLIFPKLPDDWTIFHLVEHTADDVGFGFRNIQRNNSGVYRLTIR